MWFNTADKKLAFSNPPNITPFKIGINCFAYTEFVNWEIVKIRIGVVLLGPLKNFCQMGNSKCLKR